VDTITFTATQASFELLNILEGRKESWVGFGYLGPSEGRGGRVSPNDSEGNIFSQRPYWYGAAKSLLKRSPRLHAVTVAAILAGRRSLRRVHALRRRLAAPYHLWRYGEVLNPDQIYLRRLFRRKERVTFAQIGAHDGVTIDPLHHLLTPDNCAGLCVEPVPELFERLVDNRRHLPEVTFENVAVAALAGSATFYAVKPEIRNVQPLWGDTIGSLSLDSIRSVQDLIPDLDSYIVKRRVRCERLDPRLDKHGFETVDYVLIDAEGHDFEVLSQIDLARRRPLLVMYEDKHMRAEDRAASRYRFEDAGYTVKRTNFLDSIAIHPTLQSLGDRVVASFRRFSRRFGRHNRFG
jgi:FkbM family methyltransferase